MPSLPAGACSRLVWYGTKVCTSCVTLGGYDGSGEDFCSVYCQVKSNTRWKTNIDKVVVDFVKHGTLVHKFSDG